MALAWRNRSQSFRRWIRVWPTIHAWIRRKHLAQLCDDIQHQCDEYAESGDVKPQVTRLARKCEQRTSRPRDDQGIDDAASSKQHRGDKPKSQERACRDQKGQRKYPGVPITHCSTITTTKVPWLFRAAPIHKPNTEKREYLDNDVGPNS